MPKSTKKPKKSSLKQQAQFSSRQLLAFASVLTLIGVVVIWKSFAAPPSKTGAAPLALTAEYTQNTPNTSAPKDCLNEDDYHERDYAGSLNGTYTVTDSDSVTDSLGKPVPHVPYEKLCNDEFLNGIYWDSGGIGLVAESFVSASGSCDPTGAASGLTTMSITAPNGPVHDAVLHDCSTYRKVSTYHYQACFVPNYSVTYDVGSGSLNQSNPGNPWKYTISGNISRVTWKIRADMTDVAEQKAYCPPSEQNLSP